MSETKVHLEHHGEDFHAVVTATSAAVAVNEYRTLLQGLASAVDVPAANDEPEKTETPVPDLDEARAKEEARKEAARKAAETRRKNKEAKEEAAKAEAEAAGTEGDDSGEGDDFDFDFETDAADTPTYTPEDVRKALAPLGRSKGIPLLKEFKAAKISQLKPEQYADVIARAKELAAA